MIADRIAKKLIAGNELRRQMVNHRGFGVVFVEVKDGCLIDRWLAAFSKAAITLGRTVILRDGRTTQRRIRHELVHVDQWERYGVLFFLVYAFRWKKLEEVAEAAEKKTEVKG
jgi:hypothetical protein